MRDDKKTKAELIRELNELRRRVSVSGSAIALVEPPDIEDLVKPEGADLKTRTTMAGEPEEPGKIGEPEKREHFGKKKTEKIKLRKSVSTEELQLKDLAFKSSANAESLSNNEGVITHANIAFAQIWGFEKVEEVVGKHISKLLESEEKANALIALIEEKGEWEGEFLARKKNGLRFVGQGKAVAVHDWEGKQVATHIAVMDITERKWAMRELMSCVKDRSIELEAVNEKLKREIEERKLAEEEIRNQARFPDENPNPVMRADKDGKITYANKSSVPLLEVWGAKVGRALPEEYLKIAVSCMKSWEKRDFETIYADRVFFVMFCPIQSAGYLNIYAIDITIRKEIETALRESEEKYRVLFESMTEGFVLYEVILNEKNEPYDLRFIDLNPAFERMVHLKKEDVLGKRILDVLPNQEFDWIKTCGEVALTGKPIHFEHFSKRLKIYFEMFAYSPSKGRFALVLSDITERKKAEDSLKESEERYRSLFDNMSEGFALHDIICDENGEPCDYRFLEINPSFERLTGLKRENVVGRKLSEALAGTNPRFVKEYGAVALTGKPIHFEEYEPITNKYYDIISYCPAPGKFAVIFMDVTERKRVQEESLRLNLAVKEERDRLAALINSIQDEVWFADTQGRLTLANPSSIKYLGLDATGEIDDEMVLEKAKKYLPDGSPLEQSEIPIMHSLKGEIVKNFDIMLKINESGEIRYQQANSAPVRDAYGNVIGAVATRRDVTELKKTEEALKKAKDELEIRVLERTEELKKANEALAAEKKRFVDVLDVIPAYVVLLDEDYRVPFDNKFFRDRFGESHGRRCHDYLFNRETPCENCETYKVMKTWAPHRWEWTGPDGRNYDIYDFPFIDTDGSKMILEMGLDITEQKQASEALRESEQKLNMVLESGETGAWDLDIILDTAWRSLRHDQIFGYDSLLPDWGVKKFAEHIVPEDREMVKEAFETAKKTGSLFFECRIRRADNKVRWITAHGSVHYNEKGEAIRMMGTVNDITQQKKAQEVVRRSEATLKEAQRMAHIGNWELDIVENVLVWSDEIYRIFEVDQEKFEASYEAFLDAIHPEDREMVNEAYTKSLKNKQPYEVDHRLLMKDGTVKYVHERCETFYDKDGKAIRSVGTVHDITERKMAEEVVRQAFEYNRSLIEASPDPLVAIGPDGKITDVNSATEKATGLSRLELIGTDFSDYFTEPDKARAGYRQAFREGIVQDYPLDLLHRDGSTISVLYNASVYWDEVGQAVGVFAAARDVTKRKKAEMALIKAFEDLERSNLELEQFAYVASHDLQEPLRMVTSYVQLLQRRYQGKLDHDADEFIGYAIEGANRMKSLISDLLQISRVSTRGKDFELKKSDSMLDQAISNLGIALKETGAKIIRDELPEIFADEGQLVQVFQNLLANSIKFRRDENPEIRVSAEKDGNYWRFSVKDNGLGIESKYYDRIFVIFQRLYSREKYPGTGIGLAICKKIVERHGGQIWVESKPDEGSTFFFTIPASRDFMPKEDKEELI